MNGKKQVQQYARLGGYVFKPGDLVDVKQLGRCEVIAVMPDGFIQLRTQQRCPVLVKRSICERVR